MFSREDLECLDPGYFEIIYMDDRDEDPEVLEKGSKFRQRKQSLM